MTFHYSLTRLPRPLCMAALLLLLLFLLHGCATMSEAECTGADWAHRGQDDGAAGRPRSYIGNHIEACNQYGIDPDAEAWRAGWDEGIEHFCTRRNGWRQGLDGAHHGNVCPLSLQADFLDAYEIGLRIHTRRMAVDSLESEMVQVNEDIDELTAETEPTEGRKLKNRRKRLRRELAAARLQLALAEQDARNAGFLVP